MDEIVKPPLTHFVGLKFDETGRTYFFSTPFSDSLEGDILVADTINGIEMGIVSERPKPIEEYAGATDLRPIMRKPTKSDLDQYEEAIKKSKKIIKVATAEAAKLGLEMQINDATYSPYRNTTTITFFAEHRIDFRELARNLAAIFGGYIELRMIASRDKAKMVGGLGLCGLPLCCSSFLSNFDTITIAMAKNQMLTLNIPKLSGPCNKLMCCLAYEDDLYTKAKGKFPKVGTHLKILDGEYIVKDYNILSTNVRIYNAENESDIQTVKLDELNDIIAGRKKAITTIEKLDSSENSIPESRFLEEYEKEQKEKEIKAQNQAKKENNNNRQNFKGKGPRHFRPHKGYHKK